MKNGTNNSFAKRVAAIALGATMAMSTAAYAAPMEMFLKDSTGVVRKFNLASLSSNPEMRAAFRQYLIQAVTTTNGIYVNDITGGTSKVVNYSATSGTTYSEQKADAAHIVTTAPAATFVVNENGSDIPVTSAAGTVVITYAAPTVETTTGKAITVAAPTLTGDAVTSPVWTKVGNWNEGLVLDAATGAITGSIDTVGTYTANVKVTSGTVYGTAVVTFVVAANTSTDPGTVTPTAITVSTASAVSATTLTVTLSSPTAVALTGAAFALKSNGVATGGSISAATSDSKTYTLTLGSAIANGTYTIAVTYATGATTSDTTFTVALGGGGNPGTTTPITVTSATIVSSTAITLVTGNTSGVAITTSDFTVVNDGTTVAPASIKVTSNSATSYTITLPTPVTAGKTVVLTTKGNFAAATFSMVYESGVINGGAVTGYIDDKGVAKNISGVSVVIRNAVGTEVGNAVTGADGTFKVYNVKAGNYTAQYSKVGFSSEIDYATTTQFAVTATGYTLPAKALKSVNATVKSVDATKAVVDGDTIKIPPTTKVSDIAATLTRAYGASTTKAAIGDNKSIVILKNATSTTKITTADAVVTSLNAIQVIAEDGATKKVYSVTEVSADDMKILSVKFGTPTVVGTVKLENVSATMSYKISGNSKEFGISGTTVDFAAAIGDVITVWTGTDATAVGKFTTLTVTADDIKAPAQAAIVASQVVANTTTVALSAKIEGYTISGLKLYASTVATESAFTVGTAVGLGYVEGELKATLSDKLVDGTYYLYVVHAASGVVSPKSAAFEVDTTAPVITNFTVKRTEPSKAQITFTSTEKVTQPTAGNGAFVAFTTMDYQTITTEKTKAIAGAKVGSATTASTTLAGVSFGAGNPYVLNDGLPEDGASAKLTFVVIDKAGNISTPITTEVAAYAKVIPVGQLTKILPKGTATVAVQGPSEQEISLQEDGSISCNGTRYSNSAANYALVKTWLDTIPAGDKISLDMDGKLQELQHLSPSALTVELKDGQIVDYPQITGNATGKLTLTGTIGTAYVQLKGEVYSKFDFSGLKADGAATISEGILNLQQDFKQNILVGEGLKVVTNASNATSINAVSFAGNNTLIQVAAGNTFNVRPGAQLKIDASESTNSVKVNFTNSGSQNGFVAIGQPVTSDVSLTVSATDITIAGSQSVEGGRVRLGAYTAYTVNVSAGALATEIFEDNAGTHGIVVTTNAQGKTKINSADYIQTNGTGTGHVIELAAGVPAANFNADTILKGTVTIPESDRGWTVQHGKVLTIPTGSAITNNGFIAGNVDGVSGAVGTLNVFGTFNSDAASSNFQFKKLIVSGSAATFSLKLQNGETVSIGQADSPITIDDNNSGVVLTVVGNGISYDFYGNITVKSTFTVGNTDLLKLEENAVVNVGPSGSLIIRDYYVGSIGANAKKLVMAATSKIKVADGGVLELDHVSTAGVVANATISLATGSSLYVGQLGNFKDGDKTATSAGPLAGLGKYTVVGSAVAVKDDQFCAGDYKATETDSKIVFTRTAPSAE